MFNIYSKSTLRAFYNQKKYSDSKNQVDEWYHYVSKATWKNNNELKSSIRNASIIKNNRVVFNICGNKYRLIVKIRFDIRKMFVRFIGTHKQYDEIENIEGI
ncbi:MAG: type II toxin-antitoxin system HigB family toxin [Pseudomonadota bacterium]